MVAVYVLCLFYDVHVDQNKQINKYCVRYLGYV